MNKFRTCLDCDAIVSGTMKRCNVHAFEVNRERSRVRSNRRLGLIFRLTDLEIPKAQELQRSGLRTDEIARELGLPEACIANSLWAEKFGERA